MDENTRTQIERAREYLLRARVQLQQAEETLDTLAAGQGYAELWLTGEALHPTHEGNKPL